MSQGTVKKHRRIKLYALGVSVFAHIVGLSVFAAVKISQSPPVRLQTTTVVSISQAAKLADRQAVTPKPKVNPVDSKPFDSSGALKADIIQGRPIVKADGKGTQANARPVFDLPKEDYQRQAEEVKQPIQSRGICGDQRRGIGGEYRIFRQPGAGQEDLLRCRLLGEYAGIVETRAGRAC